MEVKFMKKPLQCLNPFFSQIHTQEQTQEIRLPDAYPDIGKVLGCWGQVLMRGKEWRSTSMGANGGVMAWIMYAPEDGTQNRVIDVWIPIQCRWEFSTPADDGVMILRSVLSALDGRGISARKIMVRAGVDTFAQAMSRQTMEIPYPGEMPEDVQLLRRSYPAELPMEAGEKQVQMEETLPLEGDLANVQKIIHYLLKPVVSEQKVLGNRLVFRGQTDVSMSYMTQDGTVAHWETEIPFSQYTELDRDYGPNATAWVMPMVTAMEMELTPEQQLRIRCGIAAQYTIFDMEMLELVEDAFSPSREVLPQIKEMQFPILLDSTVLEMPMNGVVKDDIQRMENVSVHGEYPRLSVGNEGMQIQMDGHFQTVYRNSEDIMSGESVRFESGVPIDSALENQTQLWPGFPMEPEILPSGEGMNIRSVCPVLLQVYSGQSIPVVTELEIGEQRQPDPNRPSLILRRANDEGLWSIAKAYGSTVSDIQKANQLAGEPESGQMLLIPIS